MPTLRARSKPVEVEGPSVSRLATEIMAELNASLAQLLGAAGEPIARAVDVERVFRLDKTLSWQVFRLSQSPDVAEAGNVPSRTAVRRLLQAARRRRVPAPMLDRVSAAFDEFERLASVQGGDRAGLMSMVSDLLGEQGQKYELKVRKTLFRGNAHVWGVQARLATRTAIYMPRRIDEGRRTGDLTFLAGDLAIAHRRQTQSLVTQRWLWTHEDVGSSRVDLQACKLEYSIVSPK